MESVEKMVSDFALRVYCDIYGHWLNLEYYYADKAVLDTLLADNESAIATIGKAIEEALPFCSLRFKGQMLDKFFEVAKF